MASTSTASMSAAPQPSTSSSSSRIVEMPLPEGWEARRSRTNGKIYFLNKHIMKSQWRKPRHPAPTVEQVEKSMVAPPIWCSHVLIKHVESRRPTSWRQKIITRSKAHAKQKLEALRKMINDHEISFARCARRFSDCSSARHNGELGCLKKGQLQKSFERVAFGLEVGQISRVIESRSGYHLILRTG